MNAEAPVWIPSQIRKVTTVNDEPAISTSSSTAMNTARTAAQGASIFDVTPTDIIQTKLYVGNIPTSAMGQDLPHILFSSLKVTVSAPIKDSEAFFHIYADFTTALDARFGLESARKVSANLVVRFAWKTDDFDQTPENKELHAIESFIKNQEWMLAGLRKEAEKMGITLTFGLNVGANSQAVIYNEQGLLVPAEDKKALEDDTGSVIRTPAAAGKNSLVKHWLRDQFPDADNDTQTDAADIPEQTILPLAESLTLSHVSMSQGMADIADVPVPVSVNGETAPSSEFTWSQVDRPDPFEATIIGAAPVEPTIPEETPSVIDDFEIASISPNSKSDSSGVNATASEEFTGYHLSPLGQHPEITTTAAPGSDNAMQQGTSIDTVYAWELDPRFRRQVGSHSAADTTSESKDAGRFDDPVSDVSTSSFVADLSSDMTWVNGTTNASMAASPTLVNILENAHHATRVEVQSRHIDNANLMNGDFDADNVSEISTSPSLAELTQELSLSLASMDDANTLFDFPVRHQVDFGFSTHEDSHQNSIGATRNNTHAATPIARRQELHRQISSVDLASALAALDVICEDPDVDNNADDDVTGVNQQRIRVPSVQLNGDDVGDTSLLSVASEPRLVDEGIPCALLIASCNDMLEIFMDIIPEQYHDYVSDIDETQGTKFYIVKFFNPALAKEVYPQIHPRYTEGDLEKRDKNVPFVSLLQEEYEFFNSLPKVGNLQGKNETNALPVPTVDGVSRETLTNDGGQQDNTVETTINHNNVHEHGEGNKNKNPIFDFPELYEFNDDISMEKRGDMEIDLSMFP
ncbi:hypothetical protein BZA77DRAFT_372207 [Pyronema omphalodes]|nr:hypothetical protein BZA77DRAFT_372207 [Pyronema omphalodes]